MLEKKGFEVCLIDEFKTSSFCVTVHGLLRCINRNCMAPSNDSRLWNRDLFVVLNFQHILHGLRRDGSRPSFVSS
ncbi:hypothetical protein BGW37DRAFT_478230 [Umbelopsis sp. PMI_123]|nr:hypothetical protein BGW37DRAFT_478230 [Umbelopsis sp. PMI_123]